MLTTTSFELQHLRGRKLGIVLLVIFHKDLYLGINGVKRSLCADFHEFQVQVQYMCSYPVRCCKLFGTTARPAFDFAEVLLAQKDV